METTHMTSFSLRKETVERLKKYSDKESINKSALVDRLLNEEIDKKEGINKLQVNLTLNGKKIQEAILSNVTEIK